MTLTAHERRVIHQAIDTERRRIVQPTTSGSLGTGNAGSSLADWCLTEAHGDPLLAVGLAVSAREAVRRRRSLGELE